MSHNFLGKGNPAKRSFVVYICGAYRGKSVNDIYENIQKARKVSLKYWRFGYAVFCPHMNTALMDGACPDTVWLEGALEILRRCDVIVMMKGWKESEGSVEEHKLAKELSKIIFYE